MNVVVGIWGAAIENGAGAQRRGDGLRVGNDLGSHKIENQNVGKVAFLDPGKMSDAFRSDPPVDALVGAQVTSLVTNSGCQDDL